MFGVIPWRLGSNSRRFVTLYRLHLHGQVGRMTGMRRAKITQKKTYYILNTAKA